MGHNRQSVDKTTFKQIFRDHWESFQQRYPRYQQRDVQTVIDKMLGCGELASGYSTYVCEHCLEEKRVAFSGKSSFCLSCCKVYIDQWVAHIGQTLYGGKISTRIKMRTPTIPPTIAPTTAPSPPPTSQPTARPIQRSNIPNSRNA